MKVRHLAKLAAALLLPVLVPAGAASAAPTLPAVERTLTVHKAAATSCGANARRGAARTAYTAPMSGFVTVRLAAARGDWDLTLVDAQSRRTMATSNGFRAREVAQTWVQSGQALLVQGCRRSGPASRANVSIQFLDAAPPAPSTPSLVRVQRPSAEVLQWLDAGGFDVTHNMRSDYADVVVPDATALKTLEGSGVPFVTRTSDLNAYYAESRRADARYAAAVGRSPLPTGRTGYRQYPAYQNELKQITNPKGPYAQIARPVVIGHSFQGREIQGVELASNVAAKADGRPVYLVVGLHHAREWPSAEIAMEFAWMLAKGYGHDAALTDLLKRERVVIVPIINPDGFFASRAAAKDGMFPDPADSTGAPEGDTVEGVAVPFGGNLAYRRKNCDGPVPSAGGAERDYPCYYQWGVDPNRNYGQGWGGPGASPDPNTQVYRGADQWSEPETQAVHASSQTHPVTAVISLHNVAALVLRPPGLHTAGKAPDEVILKQLGDAMADRTGYTSQYGFQLYDTSGTTEDWNYAAAGSLGYTIEIGPLDGQFHMPYQTGVVGEWLGPPVDPKKPNGARKGGMREALLLAAQAAADPSKHSVLTGAAPKGTVLHLKKRFPTQSSPVCSFAQGYVRAGTVPALDCIGPGSTRSQADKLDYSTEVTGSRFTWHVTPSTRPFVGGKYIEGKKLVRTESFAGAGPTTPAPSKPVEKQFEVTSADMARDLDLKLDWTSKAEDYDLNLYYIEADGKRTPIGTGWLVDGAVFWTAPGGGVNPNGLPEHITLTNPPVGRYVARITPSTAAVDDWTLTVVRSGQQDGHVVSTGRTEAWTLTCQRPGGGVFTSRQVKVARGQRLELGTACR